jgi:glutaminyl-peptide cyclotransferase
MVLMIRSTRRPLAVYGSLLIPLALAACPDDQAKGSEPPQGAQMIPPAVVRSYPHDATAFTQGLVYLDGDLLESTGRNGQSTFRRVRLQTGEVLRKIDVPEQYFAEGLTVLNGKAYQLTWQQGEGFVYDLASFVQTGTFRYEGEGWGLTTDGRSLILSDGSDQLRFIDPNGYVVTRTVSVNDGDQPVNNLNELEWVRGEIWANVWHDRRIARIDPQSGRVREWIDLSQIYPEAETVDEEAVPNGIAWDDAGGRLFITGKLWPRLFEITVADLARAGASPVPAETTARTAP